MSKFLVPIGQLSEEAQEARNKDIKRYRLIHSRKYCREATNTDILNRLLESSDPLISMIRHQVPEVNRNFTEDTKALLVIDDSDSDSCIEEDD